MPNQNTKALTLAQETTKNRGCKNHMKLTLHHDLRKKSNELGVCQLI